MAKVPTITMIGPKGPVVVNASDQSRFEAEGYTLEEKKPIAKAEEKKSVKDKLGL